MNTLTLVLLALVAYVFWQSGSTFLAMLVLAVGLIMALSGSQQQPSHHAPGAGGYPAGYPGGQMPIVVNAGGGGGASLPRKFEFRPNFPGDPDGDEWISGKLGMWIVLIVRAFAKIFSLGSKKPAAEEGGH
ncbi:MAG: hypothetical protein V1708_04225 [Candidatus Micrarchaeota archaeon]